ncbi:nitroreductase/quinone reductase family protein [Parafrankia elaeagni]|uniref:nitroreductase/quinone reductase family protein n=1 Tax=Parafrankia elaeagni TaxID=222534 RepID=UPI000685F44A|nr:nitroreductase/quinone reductase family protein [Parafrankia elaeagni]
MFEGSALCLLTTTGARTGQPRTQPLGLMQIDGQDLVVASAAGAPTHPAWYHNIRKDAIMMVETGDRTYRAIASIPPPEERDRLFSEIAAQEPGYGEYQAKTDRIIPVIALHPIDLDPDRVKHLGDTLVELHEWLRGDLAELRRRIDDVVEGRAGSHSAITSTVAACPIPQTIMTRPRSKRSLTTPVKEPSSDGAKSPTSRSNAIASPWPVPSAT